MKAALILCLSVTLVRKEEIDQLKAELLDSEGRREGPRLSDNVDENS